MPWRPEKCFDGGFEYGDSESDVRIELARICRALHAHVGQNVYSCSTEFRGTSLKWRSDLDSLQNLASVSQNLGVGGIFTAGYKG